MMVKIRETTWIDFEIWCSDVQVIGYMADDDHKLQWIGHDGLECYDDFSKTNPVGETANNHREFETLYRWCLIQNFLEKVDITSTLAEHVHDNIIVTYGNQFDEVQIKLYINSSEFDQGDGWGYDDQLDAFVKIMESK